MGNLLDGGREEFNKLKEIEDSIMPEDVDKRENFGMPALGDKYNSNIIKGIIEFLDDDMNRHIAEMSKYRDMIPQFLEQPLFLDYVFTQIRLEYYDGYRVAKLQRDAYIKVQAENETS